MNTLPCIGPRFDRRNALLENLLVKRFILLLPRTSLLRRATIGWASPSLIRQKTEGTSGGGAVASKAENDRRLVRAIKGSEKMPARIGSDLRQFGRNTRTRGRRDLRQSFAAAPRGEA